jgi:periplasmic protein TonB
MPGTDLLDQRDPMGVPLTESLLFHAALLASIVVVPMLLPKPFQLGDPNQHSGAIGVEMVKKIPIPRPEGPTNRLANDSKSVLPQAPKPKTEPKPAVKEKAPPPDAIRISDKTKEKPKKRAAALDTFPPDVPFKKNQLYSDTPQRLISPNIGMQGNNGVGFGTTSPFGDQYGWYAQQISDRINQKWNRADVTSRPHARTIIRFTLLRDGSVQNIQTTQQSGSYTLDSSAERAVRDAVLPPFPRGFPSNSISLDVNFELQQ